MKPLIVFLIVCLFSISCYAQKDLFVLHSLVGDTIDKNEKLSYFLFPKIDNADYKYCYITRSNDQFFVNSYNLNDSVNIQPIDTTEIRLYIDHLDKLLSYYLNEDKKDSLNKAKGINLDFKDNNSPFRNTKLVGNQAMKRIRGEVERDNRMKHDAQNFNMTRQGANLMGGTPYFTPLFSVKKKK